jgi:hypothetical protein
MNIVQQQVTPPPEKSGLSEKAPQQHHHPATGQQLPTTYDINNIPIRPTALGTPDDHRS